MEPRRFVALLRGINLGGNNIIKMADLRATFEAMGLHRVRTYIQSGNVAFATERPTRTDELTNTIETVLSETYGYHSREPVGWTFDGRLLGLKLHDYSSRLHGSTLTSADRSVRPNADHGRPRPEMRRTGLARAVCSSGVGHDPTCPPPCVTLLVGC